MNWIVVLFARTGWLSLTLLRCCCCCYEIARSLDLGKRWKGAAAAVYNTLKTSYPKTPARD